MLPGHLCMQKILEVAFLGAANVSISKLLISRCAYLPDAMTGRLPATLVPLLGYKSPALAGTRLIKYP